VDRTAAERVLAVAPDQRRLARARSRHRILRFFDGFELLAPGLTDVERWRQEDAPSTRLRIAGESAASLDIGLEHVTFLP
jgi:hypothetical protein